MLVIFFNFGDMLKDTELDTLKKLLCFEGEGANLKEPVAKFGIL